MMSEDMELQGIGAAAWPDWLKGLIRAVRSEAIQPKDARVKSLWDLLRQRQLLRRSPWLKAVLRRIWTRGLSARPHPRTARRIVHRLRRWGVLPPKSARGGSSPDGHAPFSPCRSAGSAARGPKASRFGAACGDATGTTCADAAGSHERGAKMNCQCSKCSGGRSGKTPPIGRASIPCRFKACGKGQTYTKLSMASGLLA